MKQKSRSRFKPPSDADRKTGAIVGFIRRMKGWTQRDLAERVGSTRDAISNVESGRVPLDAASGWKIAEQLEKWPGILITGHDQHWPMIIPELKEWLDGFFSAAGSAPFRDVWARVGWLAALDQTGQGEFVRRMQNVAASAASAGSSSAGPVPPTQKSALDTSSQKSNLENDMSEIAKLVSRLKLATAEKGAKARLADWMEVSPARITEWLSGKKSPGGNSTLRLLKWVEEQERKCTGPKDGKKK